MSSKPGVVAMILSVLASAFGVQSQQNYERDFNSGQIAGYIIIGVVFVAVLVVLLALLVNVIIN
ncbi:DUF2970 domain-containing protein [Alteromonas sp. C1M14]|nr:DUF2970 domain-containing protein [Alteromonas sp. C1M14]